MENSINIPNFSMNFQENAECGMKSTIDYNSGIESTIDIIIDFSYIIKIKK